MEQKGLPSFSKVMMTVDSLHVKGLIDEKFVARENRALAASLCHLWIVTKKKLQLHIRWVRGHTGDVGNSIAHELADLGTRLEAQYRWWKRVQRMGEWEEDVLKAKMMSLQSVDVVHAPALCGLSLDYKEKKHHVNKLFASSGQAW